MEETQDTLTKSQKIIAVLFVITFIALGAFFILNRTGFIDKALNNSLIPDNAHTYFAEKDNALLNAVLFCDITTAACATTLDLLSDFSTEITNETNFAYRHGIDMNNDRAVAAAIAAEVAGDYGKFWDMLFMLYAFQYEWVDAQNHEDFFKQYAQLLDIEPNKYFLQFRDALDKSSPYYKKIAADSKYAKSNELTSPAVFLNGNKVEGELTYEMLNNLVTQLQNEAGRTQQNEQGDFFEQQMQLYDEVSPEE